MSDPLIGQIINGKFRIQSAIGQGGMGKIYRAEQLPLGRAVALKVLRQTSVMLEHDPAFQRRFFLEASLCAKLSHPNIVTVYDYGQIENIDGEAYFLAMEFLEGMTLNQRMRERGGALTLGESLSISLEIARGLREAHRAGIVHRDLKPGNVMLVPDAETGEKVKIVDFGLVKQVEGDSREDLTKENSCLGSPRYMSPEQVEGDTCDHRSDLYSLGVIMYQCLSGRVPFEFEKSVLILMAHVSTPVPPMRERNPLCDVPPNIEAFVRRLLEKRPDARPSSAEEVVQQIRALQHELGQTTQSTQSPIPRTTLGLVAPVSPSGEHVTGENSAGTLIGTQINTGHNTRKKSIVPIAVGVGLLALVGIGAVALRGSSSAQNTASAPQTTTSAAAGTSRTTEADPSVHTLRIESNPAGAAVSERGAHIGVTPMTIALDAAQSGNRDFVLTLPGHQPYTLSQGPSRESVRVMAALVREAPANPGTAVAQTAQPEPATTATQTAPTSTAQGRPAANVRRVVVRRQPPSGNSGGGGGSSGGGGSPLDIRLER